MDLFYLLAVYVTLQTWLASDCQTLNDSETLVKHLLNNHDIKSRPLLNQSKPLFINISFAINSLMELEEVDGKLFIGGIIYVTWIDETKQWHPEQYGGIMSELLPYDELWHPTIAVVSVYEEVDSLLKAVKKIKVYYDGTVTLNAQVVFKSRCIIDVTFYPFDTQHCYVYIASQDYTPAELILNSEFPDVPLVFYMEHGEWSLEQSGALSDVLYSGYNLAISYVQFDFKFKRNSEFFVMNTIVPIIMMTVLNTFVFLLPPESGERVSYAITVLLALAVFLSITGDTLPKTSIPVPIISHFIVAILSISTLVCVFAILNLRLYFKAGKPPIYLCRLAKLFSCCLPTSKASDVPRWKQTNSMSIDDVDNGTNNIDIAMEDSTKFVRLCSWKHIGVFVDRICTVSFFLLITTLTLLFLIVLVTNNDVFGLSRDIQLPGSMQ